ncbi:MAG: N-formylglutamate deformylase [Sphingomonadales bacterium 28-64-96]|nr:MAG: N-formylglutamate deformylase [Sphingomonadales bacterium 28-64-96]
MTTPAWLTVRPANTPLILAMPHGGSWVPDHLLSRFASPWVATRDADWHIAELYDGLAEATIVATDVSRSVIDLNRDPSGASLYPGQATTGLCPTTDFDGAPLYQPGQEPDDAEIAMRRETYFAPYHDALTAEIVRLRAHHDRVVVYDCHSIRSRIPRLFDGLLPEFNLGTNGGATCDPALTDAVMAVLNASGRSHVCDGRFRGGWTTRHYGQPLSGVHAIQMETAMRAYLVEPDGAVDVGTWPPAWDAEHAADARATLSRVLVAALAFTN